MQSTLHSTWKNFLISLFILTVTTGQAREQEQKTGTSLVVQWLRLCLPMQTTQVPPLVWEDSTWLKALSPGATATEACTPQPLSEPMCCNYRSRHTPESVLCNKRSHHNEKSMHRNQKGDPLNTTRESPHAVTKAQSSHKMNKSLKKGKQKKF